MAGPATPVARAVQDWQAQCLPPAFRADRPCAVFLLSDPDMDSYLRRNGIDPRTEASSDSGGGRVDGVFDRRADRVSVRMPTPEQTAPEQTAPEQAAPEQISQPTSAAGEIGLRTSAAGEIGLRTSAAGEVSLRMPAPSEVSLRTPLRDEVSLPPLAVGEDTLKTLAHEYGHFVWFNLLSRDDRKRYGECYRRQRDADHLVTEYARENQEEGFAEAFAYYIMHRAFLAARDAASDQFLVQWEAAHSDGAVAARPLSENAEKPSSTPTRPQIRAGGIGAGGSVPSPNAG